MVLKSRPSKRHGHDRTLINPKNIKEDEMDDDDDDDRKKNKSHSWSIQRLARQAFKKRWWRVVTLILLNGIVYLLWPQAVSSSSSSSSSSLCNALSSFSAWNQFTKVVVSSSASSPFQRTSRIRYTPTHTHTMPFRFPSFSSSRRMAPSLAERIEFYMGPHWFNPKLQGHPPSSPFLQQNIMFKPTRKQIMEQEQHDSLVMMHSINPHELYECATGVGNSSLLCTNNAPMKQLAYDTMDAAFLVQEYYQNNIVSHYYNVWKYEGILGCFVEFWFPLQRRAQTKSTYVWAQYPYDQTVATATYNTITPVFGRIRDLQADQDAEFYRHARSHQHHHDDGAGTGAGAGLQSVHATILWPLLLHFDRTWLSQTLPTYDVPWEYKLDDKLYWRGNVTDVGQHVQIYLESYRASNVVDMMDSMDKEQHVTTGHVYSQSSTIMQTLRHKYVLVLEGEKSTPNDLLYKLYSNSVVFMPQPTYTSWFMESWLEPYVHYIPIDHTNIESQLAWAKANPQHVQRIAERSTQWVYDILFHPDAARDEAHIMHAMIHRYQQYILRAKPILIPWTSRRSGTSTSTHVYDVCTKQIHDWYSWLTDDWLRIAFVMVMFLYRYL